MLDPAPLTPFPHNENGIPTLSQTPFSPPYQFNTLGSLNGGDGTGYDPMFGMPNSGFGGWGNGMGGNSIGATPIAATGMGGGGGMNGGMENVMTPGARSDGRSTGTGTGGEGEEKDPFLSLLEQLAENEHSRGGPSELDFFLSGGNA